MTVCQFFSCVELLFFFLECHVTFRCVFKVKEETVGRTCACLAKALVSKSVCLLIRAVHAMFINKYTPLCASQ